MGIRYIFGGSAEEKKKRSAYYWAENLNITTPILMISGSADWRVDPVGAIKLSEKLIKNKIPHRLLMFEGTDHHITERATESREQIISWFNRFIIKNEATPNKQPHGD